MPEPELAPAPASEAAPPVVVRLNEAFPVAAPPPREWWIWSAARARLPSSSCEIALTQERIRDRPPPRKRKPPPPGISPRGLSRTEAAAYVGVGGTLFDGLVRAGILPASIRVGRRAIWDRGALDAALTTMAGGAPPRPTGGTEPNPWDAILGTAP